MHDQETTPTPVSAPSVVRDTTEREHIKALAAAAAFAVKGDCQHCNGTGYGTQTVRKIVHSFGATWFGADWNLDRVLAAIDAAEYVRWIDGSGHDLVVEHNGQPYRFAVKRPAQAEDAA